MSCSFTIRSSAGGKALVVCIVLCAVFVLFIKSSFVVFVIINSHNIILQSLQDKLGNHVRFDVTLLVEQFSNPIGGNALIPLSNLFKTISNQKFEAFVVHCRKSGEFNAEKTESVSKLLRIPILIILFFRHSEDLSHLLFIIIGDVEDFTRHVSNLGPEFFKHWGAIPLNMAKIHHLTGSGGIGGQPLNWPTSLDLIAQTAYDLERLRIHRE